MRNGILLNIRAEKFRERERKKRNKHTTKSDFVVVKNRAKDALFWSSVRFVGFIYFAVFYDFCSASLER